VKFQLITLPVATLEVCDRTRVRQQKPKDGSDIVMEYAEAYQCGLIVEPLDVFREKGTERYIVADGEHRLLALRRAKIAKVECRLHEGDEVAALDFAIGCNQTHGVRRTDRDKYHALVRIMETPLRDKYRTDTELSEKIGVSIATIRRYKAQWRNSDGGDARVRAKKDAARASAERNTANALKNTGTVSRDTVQVAEATNKFFATTRNCDSESRPSNTSARSVKGAVMNPPESAAQGSEAGNRNKPVGVDTGPVRPPVPGPGPTDTALAREFLHAIGLASMLPPAEDVRAALKGQIDWPQVEYAHQWLTELLAER
jgi:hypothetical protein